MEPHAAQDRLSFVCNWKHMQSEAESKAERPQPTSAPHPAPPCTSPSSIGSGVPHFGRGQMECDRAESECIYWTTWPGNACQIQFNGTTVSRVLWGFRPSDRNVSDNRESAEEGGLDIESDMLWEHKQYCTVHSPRSVMSGHDRPWTQGRRIINSYITALYLSEIA